ncbi:hypothetical protein GCM10022214_71330 [Actinomadura miaoliensis]|uniref:Uncharacterized protein n=1 Tax=Actinomadura miaoliensis TaxID=430685 RepID=A0ABP7WWI8_9ACTN
MELLLQKVGDVNKKWFKMAGLAFVIWYIVSRPEAAAGLVNQSLGGLGSAAESFSTFVSAIP